MTNIQPDDFISFIESIPEEKFPPRPSPSFQEYLRERWPTTLANGTNDFYPTNESISPGLLEIHNFVLNEIRYNPHARTHSGRISPETDHQLYERILLCTAEIEDLLPMERLIYPNAQYTIEEVDDDDIKHTSIFTSWNNDQADIILTEFQGTDAAFISKIFVTFNQKNEIEGYAITKYRIYANKITEIEVLCIDLNSGYYICIHRYKQGIKPKTRIHNLIETPSRIMNAIKVKTWSNPPILI